MPMPPSILSGELLNGIGRDGHLESTLEDVKRQAVCGGNDGSLFEAKKRCTDVEDNCIANCVGFYGQMDHSI